ncbi:hypothetical protein [Mycobacterium sp. 852002-51057_SCH5723018]|uniref:8-oxoguanine DNA glycosylase OGG fold protein n=1 Tax=Mycobacterium sp. 852002-51057_SCH5723018 TaxID=1834094 RepID=UPI000B0148B9|nr:hypothetical protein [Mycobacterium sp. 852002-51057_SCH5723018]
MSDPTLGIKFPKGKLRSATTQLPANVNPGVWTKYRSVADVPLPQSIHRSDLAKLAAKTDWPNDDQVRKLFVMTMAWGSGTTNGRGPRYTEAALSSVEKPALRALREARNLLQSSDIAGAYDCASQLDGVGPPFLTKWLWVVGTTVKTPWTPLILDSRVWKGLRQLRWDSQRAANSNRWGDRYVAYLKACAAWASQLREELPEGTTPEDIEYSLFMWTT